MTFKIGKATEEETYDSTLKWLLEEVDKAVDAPEGETPEDRAIVKECLTEAREIMRSPNKTGNPVMASLASQIISLGGDTGNEDLDYISWSICLIPVLAMCIYGKRHWQPES